ncbi:g11640 [Coccomyxa elongata]
MLAQHDCEGECMAEVNEMFDTLVARLTPAMLSCALPSLHVDILQNSAGSSSEIGKEQIMSALSYLLHWWILVTLVAPPPHTAKCVEKMQVLLTAVDHSPMPVLHLQNLLKSLKHHLNETTKLRYSKEETAQGQDIGDAKTFGKTATVLCTLAAHSLGYNLANTEEFDNSSEAAASALQDACTTLMLPFRFWDGLASRAAAASSMQSRAAVGTKQKHSSCADNDSASQEPAKDLQESHRPPCDGPPDAEAATCTSTPNGYASAASDNTAGRAPGGQQADCLPNSTAAEFEQAWKSVLGSVLSVASRKRSFKKETCGEIARRVCAIAERLPVNGMALVCLQLASSASNTVAEQVQKLQPGKLIVEAAQLRRERLDVLKLLGVVLQQLVKHVELNIPLAAACTAQVLKAVAGLLKHTREDFKVLDILKLLFDPMGVLLELTGPSSPPSIGEALQSCWVEVLHVLVAQERPGQSLASALSQRPSCVTGMLRPLCHGFTHSCARIRAASLELWNDPKLQCVLGKHLAGLPQDVQQALARSAELGFASQPSQPAVKPPHKPPPIAPRSALPLPIVAPPAAEHNGHLQQQQQQQQQEQQQGLATAGGTAHVVNPGKRPAARLFQDTQTEYVRIDTASKRPRKDLLTDHQKEVAARHHQGPGREGIITHTRLDVSQDALSLLKASSSVPDSERDDSPVVIDDKGPGAAHDGGVGEPVMHAWPYKGQQTSQGAAMHSTAAEEAQMPSSTAREHGVLEPECRMDGAASDEVMHNQQDCSSAQNAEMVTHEPTWSGGDQQDCMLQEAPPGATSAPAAAEGMKVSQPQGHSAPRDGPKADSTSAEGAPVLCAPQASCKGKENSDSQQQHPQQQQQWRKKRSLAQTAHHSLSPLRGPEPESGPAASKTSQRLVAVSPDVVDLSEDAPVSTGVASGTAEDPALQGQHAGSEWQPTSSQKEVRCAENAENRPDATMTEAAHDSGAPAVPADAQAADIGGHQEHHMQPSTVPESEDEDIDVGQIDGPAEEHVWGEQNIVMTAAAAMGSAPQTILQTCVLGTVPNTACAAIPATAIEPMLLSGGAPAATQVGSVMPEANKAGAHQQGQPLGIRAPVSESDVQELQLTGLTQQLGQVAKPCNGIVEKTFEGLQSAITAAVEEALEVGTRSASLQQLDALQQMLIMAAAQIGEERIRRRLL